jgi:hypothetical protein
MPTLILWPLGVLGVAQGGDGEDLRVAADRARHGPCVGASPAPGRRCPKRRTKMDIRTFRDQRTDEQSVIALWSVGPGGLHLQYSY